VLILVEAREKAQKLLDWIISHAVEGTFSSEEKKFLRDKSGEDRRVEDVLTSAITNFDEHGFEDKAS
jgi:hypothetical protein